MCKTHFHPFAVIISPFLLSMQWGQHLKKSFLLQFGNYLFLQAFSGEYEPSWVRFKYGAWYLPTKMWKKRDFEEPLQDPKELKDQEMSEAKKKSNSLVSWEMDFSKKQAQYRGIKILESLSLYL
jgi:hypothetical protein